jgi:beta-glucanase (GH16 family)
MYNDGSGWESWVLDYSAPKALPYTGITEDPVIGKIFYIGEDRCIYSFIWETNKWVCYQLSKTIKAMAGSDLYYSNTHKKLFFLDEGGLMRIMYYTTGGWVSDILGYASQPGRAGTQITEDPVIGKIFYVTSNRNIYSFSWNGSQWNNYSILLDQSYDPDGMGLTFCNDALVYQKSNDLLYACYWYSDASVMEWRDHNLNDKVKFFSNSSTFYSQKYKRLIFVGIPLKYIRTICSIYPLCNPQEKSGWNLILSEEFNGPVLDPAIWSQATGARGWGCDSFYQVYWDPANIAVMNSMLYLSVNDKTSYLEDPYWSASCISTTDLHYYRYGYVEARCKYPDVDGYWPAFWLRADNAEFDVYEPPVTQAIFSSNYGHRYEVGTGGEEDEYGKYYFEKINNIQLLSNFQTSAIERDPNDVKYYLNNEVLYSFQDPKSIYHTQEGPFPPVLPNEDFSIKLDNCPRCTEPPSTDEGKFLVDYVRVYSKDDQGFEYGFGNWYQTYNDDADWYINSIEKSLPLIGPGAALEGQHFAYVVGGAAFQNKKAKLEHTMDLNGYRDPILAFWYFMDYPYLGTLKVKTVVSGNEILLWQSESTYIQEWYNANVNLRDYAGDQIKLIIEANGIGLAPGYFAIDSIALVESWEESFEGAYGFWHPKKPCGYLPDSYECPVIWILEEATPSSSRFIPDPPDGKWYAKASSFDGSSQEAVLWQKFKINGIDHAYLEFDFYISEGNNTLEVIWEQEAWGVCANAGDCVKIWEYTGSTQGEWLHGVIDLRSEVEKLNGDWEHLSHYNEMALRFSAKLNNGFVALDNTKIYYVEKPARKNSPIAGRNSEFNIDLYPNPALDAITITHSADHNCNLTIYDGMSNVVYQGIFRNKLVLDVSGFPPGLYIGEFILEDPVRSKCHKKILVQ